ncbi:serine/threonine-protein kinase [Anaeromyxobacter sp. Fw109-5]|uniref:serine/threonine-protein kinase n=1 Tax=Anaeromyxobacter sp. (strain Fw109-5) TaxID=404589 RepID=UPI0000ED80CB|nr:serine/threonine-protein kinase [Anaeromyxobacter sp. Fw109-5]ABS25321.1 protein kinase [Anaeromyxobacter sp. Fw109-5]
MPCSSPLPTLAFGPAAAGAEPDRPGPLVDPLVGTLVGSFQILKLLGRGGMGTVYLAEHPVIGSRVAVKFLHETMATDAQGVSRFYDEARAVNLIGHENIVGIYDLSALPPHRYYYVMEYLDGETLAERVRGGPLAPELALDVLLQLCDALQCAHDHGVVHRDLKPENVFLVQRRGRRDFVKLVDFGIAKLRGARAAGRTESGVIVGTPEYMAPEQCEDGPIDARTDVYALGVIAFELATGRLPFTGRGIAPLLLAHLKTAPPRPSELAPVSPALERAILRALEKDPCARFADMAAFSAALRGARGDLPLRTPPPSPPRLPAGGAGSQKRDPARPALEAEVRFGSGVPARLPLRELTRSGAFLRADGGLPPLLSRLRLSLSHSALRAPLAVAAEVVRHVSPAEAEGWRMEPGFAVQFVDLAPEARAAIATLADAQRPAPPESPAPGGEPLLRDLEGRAGADHYGFLGVPPEAEFADVRRAVRGVREALEAARTRPGAADHPARATALLVRLDAAQAALATPTARLAHDGERGNALGVARCLAAGVPRALVDARRAQLLAATPGREAEASRQRSRAEVARKLGNSGAALAAYEAALAADPLHVATLEAYLALRRAVSPSPGR